MEPIIQYAQTKDDVSIAYWRFGEGPVLLYTPSSTISPSLRSLQTSEGRPWYEGLAESHTVVRYDNRGCGHSQSDAIDSSLEAQLLDLEAVADRVGAGRFALLGYLYSGPATIAYAVRHPDRVSRLVLWCTAASGRALTTGRGPTLEPLMESDWELFTDTVALTWFGWARAEQARSLAAALRESISPEKARAATASIRDTDVSGLLESVRSPTLVLHRANVTLPRVEAAHYLAAHIPNARLVVLEGDAAIPYVGQIGAALGAINEFLGEEGGQPAQDAAEEAVSLRTILFTDIVESTALSQRLGDARAQDVRRMHNAIVREALASHGGLEIKHTGDGIMASFPSASRALECAMGVQRGTAEQGNADLRVHIGLNAGEPIAEERDLFGTSVDLARRICDQASGGEILVSDVVRQLAAGKDFLFSDRGVADLKGFDEPVRLFEVRWREE